MGILAICTRYLELGGREVILLYLRLILVKLCSCIILCILALYLAVFKLNDW